MLLRGFGRPVASRVSWCRRKVETAALSDMKKVWPRSSRVRRRQVPWETSSRSTLIHTSWFRRLVRRIGRVETSLGFRLHEETHERSQIDIFNVNGSGEEEEAKNTDTEDVERTEDPSLIANKLFRLYKQAGRPGRAQSSDSGWAPEQITQRADRLWRYLNRSVWCNSSPPLSSRLERLEAMATLIRPGADVDVPSIINDLQNIIEDDQLNRLEETEHLAVVCAAVTCAATRCLGLEGGYAVLDLAQNRSNIDATSAPFLRQIAANLGEAAVDFTMAASLVEHTGTPVTPQILVAWLQSLGNSVHGQGNFWLAERGVRSATSFPYCGTQIKQDAEVRNAMIVVATTDKSTGALDRAFDTLNSIKLDRQALMISTCNALAVRCMKTPHRGDSIERFGEVHDRLSILEEAMLACEVRPTPALLVNLICAYSNAGDAIRVFSILQNMKTRQMPVDRRIYLEVVRALGQAKVPTPAARELLADPSRVINGLLQDMHSSGVAADANFLNGALRVYVGALDNFQALNHSASIFGKHPADRLHLASLAWELFTTSVEGSSLHSAITPNNVTYNLLIRIFCGANEYQRSVKFECNINVCCLNIRATNFCTISFVFWTSSANFLELSAFWIYWRTLNSKKAS